MTQDMRIQRIRRDINVLMKQTEDLLNLAIGEFDKRISYDPLDPIQMMLVSFVAKQCDHMRSIRALIAAGQDGDSAIIARTMIEGMAQLMWAYNNQPHGPDLWFSFGGVEDLRQMRKNEKEDGADHSDDIEFMERYLERKGENYYTPKAKRAVEEGNELPEDPYRSKWNELDAASMFRSAGAENLYDEVYRPFSGWLHWNTRAIFLTLTMIDDMPAAYQVANPRRAVGSLSAGFQALFQCLEALNTYFGLGIQPDLDSLFIEFNKVSEARVRDLRGV